MAQQSNVRFLTIFLFVSILQFSFANGFCHTSIAPSVHRSPLLKVYNTENVFDTKKFCYKPQFRIRTICSNFWLKPIYNINKPPAEAGGY
jgi:hypothetical protein